MRIPRLEIKDLKVRQVVTDYLDGRLVIPEFQREYVWKRKQAPLLLDSIYRRFPISVMLLWTSDDVVEARRKSPRQATSGSISWLIDGQQRVITLSRIIRGDEGIDVVFNPDTEEFRLANAATNKDRNWFHVSQLLDENQFRKVRRDLETDSERDSREARFDRLREVLNYEIPVVQLIDHSFDDAVEAFRRINEQGVGLKTQDIESARVAAKHSGFIRDHVAPFLEDLSRQGFSRLNVMHLFRACAFVAIPDGRSRTPLHALSKSEISHAWKRTEQATKEAIRLVRSEFGLVNMDLLWSGALLVPVIALCASVDHEDRSPQEIAGWLALAALRHRYSKATESTLDQDLKACRASDPVGQLLANIRNQVSGIKATQSQFGGSLNDKGALFAAYVACRQRGLRDLFSGASVLLQDNVDRHHVLPRAQFRESRRAESDTIANIAFVTTEANKRVGAEAPSVYLQKVKRDVLQSQCIPLDSRLWSIDRAQEFWRERRKLLADAFNEFLRKNLPRRRYGVV